MFSSVGATNQLSNHYIGRAEENNQLLSTIKASINNGCNNSALSLCQALLGSGNYSGGEVFKLKADCYLNLGEIDNAIMFYNIALSMGYRDDPFLYANHGLALTRLGSFDSAIKQFNKATMLDRYEYRFELYKAELCFNTKNFSLANYFYDMAMAKGCPINQVSEEKAACHSVEGDFEIALDWCNNFIVSDNYSARSYFFKYYIMKQFGKKEEGTYCLIKAKLKAEQAVSPHNSYNTLESIFEQNYWGGDRDALDASPERPEGQNENGDSNGSGFTQLLGESDDGEEYESSSVDSS